MTDVQIVSRVRPLRGHVDDYLARFAGMGAHVGGRWQDGVLLAAGPDGNSRPLLALDGPARLDDDAGWRLGLHATDPAVPTLALARHLAAICDGVVLDLADGRRVA